MALSRAANIATSFLASGARFAAGIRVGKVGPRPAELVELYDFEACPFCRRVRERSGREMFPFLIDPNTGVEMNESADIVAYLWKSYGDGPVPFSLQGPLFVASSLLASITRPGRGSRARGKRAPSEPLELYSFEASPYCRLAREELCELELPYVLHNVAKGSSRRRAFIARSGKMMVPYLVDPNTGTEMFESADIVAYLRETYG